MSLLTVGSVAFDEIESPFGESGKILGGAGTYVALSASYLHQGDNYLISVVGEDFPEEYMQLLKNRNIDTEGIEVVEGGKTFYWKGRYHHDMNKRDTLETQLNVLEHFDPKVPTNYKNPDYLILGNLAPDVQRKVVERLDKRPKLIAMDSMNLWMDVAMEELKKTIAVVDVLCINDDEARQLTGESNLVKAARQMQAMGPKYAIIKKGEHGALLFKEDEVYFAPALPLEEVFDPTGAGDSFIGGFMGYIAQQDDPSFTSMKRALIYAGAMASFCVEKFGPEKLKDLSDREVQERIQAFIDLSQVEIELPAAP